MAGRRVRHVGSNNVIGSTTDAPADAWSGYSAWQKYNPQVARFDFTGAGWSVPRVADGVPGNIPPGITGIWTGMGGVADCPAAYTQAQGPDQCLLQAGTLSVAHDLQSDPIHYDFFWEDYPDTPNYCNPNAPGAWGHCIVVKPNDEVYVNVTDNGDRTARFFFEDVTTGDLTNYQTDPRFPLRYLDNSTAEAIVEQNVIQWAFGTQAMYNVSFGYVQAGTANTFVQAGLNAYNDILYYHPSVACPLPIQNLCPNGDGFEDVSNGTEKYAQYCGGYH